VLRRLQQKFSTNFKSPAVCASSNGLSATQGSRRNYFTPASSSSSVLLARRATAATAATSAHCRNNLLIRRMSNSSNTATDATKKEVALLQFQVSSSKIDNQQKVKELIDTTIQNNPNVQLIVLPEIWNGPYATAAFPEYAEILPPLGYIYNDHDESAINDSDGVTATMEQNCPSAKILFDAAKKHNIYIVGGSISEKVQSDDGTTIYNTCLCISPEGKLVAKHRKVHLFDIDVKGGITFKESDTLTAGDTMSVFDTGSDLFGMVGVGICYDIRFPEYALLLTQKYACNILIYPGAFNLTTGPAHWELLQRARAVDCQCFVLTASPARTEPPPPDAPDSVTKYPHYSAWGHSSIVNPWGEVVGTCDEKESVVIAPLDMEEVKNMRQGIPTFGQKRNDLYKLVDADQKA